MLTTSTTTTVGRTLSDRWPPPEVFPPGLLRPAALALACSKRNGTPLLLMWPYREQQVSKKQHRCTEWRAGGFLRGPDGKQGGGEGIL